MTKFSPAFHEILTYRQNRACKQEVGHCDPNSVIDFFHFDNSENQGPNTAVYKISAKYIKLF